VAFARWDPIRDLLAIQQRLDRFAASPAGWVPPIDVYETPDRYVDDGRLTLSGVRPARDLACEQYHRIERGHGTFSRTFQLPVPVDPGLVTADLRDGVLTVVCPKAPQAATSKRIPIS
jgi:HSP20 family protein